MVASDAITIAPLSPRNPKPFILFPKRVFAHDPQWVAPLYLERKAFLNPRKNPFFHQAQAQLFLAYQGAEPVGRIAAVINTAHNDYHQEQAGFFGFFDCLPDSNAAATALLNAAEVWVQERGATFIRGPAHLSSNELAYGLLVEGFDTPPIFDSAYNPPYYADYIEANGYAPCKDLLAYIQDAQFPLSERIERMITRLRARRSNVVIRSINRRDLAAEVLRITQVYNSAWRDNWGFVPITESQAQHMARELKLAIIPDLALIAEIEGEPVGCLVALPDLNVALRHLNGRLTPWGLCKFFYHKRRIDTVRVAMMGVKQHYQRLGIDLLLLDQIWQRAPAKGFWRGELAWILEDNELMKRSIEAIGGVPHKRYRLYQKALG